MIFYVHFTVWGADPSGAAFREEADRASDKPDPQVRQMFQEFKHSSVEKQEPFSTVAIYFVFNFSLILLLHSTSAMSLLYECVNTVIAGNWHFILILNDAQS